MTSRFSRRTLLSTALAAGVIASVLSTAAEAADKTFALVQINQQALFFNDINRGAEEKAKELGVDLQIYNANNDPAMQNNAVETYIQEGVDGLAVVAIDVNGIMPAVEQADEAGIPVVAIDAILPDGPQKAQIGVDNAKAGADIGAYFLEYVQADMGGKAKVGIVGALNSYIQNVRQEGFQDAIEGVDGIEIVGVVDGQNVQDTALSAAENLITANPDLTAIYATGEPALMGAIAAVESQGKQNDIKIFGWDLTAQAINAIDDGFLIAVIQQDPSLMGAAAVEALNDIANGDDVEASISVPVTIVDETNVEPYRAIFK
ncbi:substrate-binding domain-containing protein [Martelella sp. AD-3]|uniref:ABC transporter substrate-binding protein n=1 Tax=Martelella sp. AD-3 TaxID=686597 RepID=UPI000464A802|nr:substrate-binding domain-containing protein [Martelella sp. AD-3]AMM86012.1 sugar ABC transporter substrate-binding protein [Martelella sp. AD-3]MAM11461.1 sugar ABC transporter substrate-binding protein [Rhizobiaceae bacterium]